MNQQKDKTAGNNRFGNRLADGINIGYKSISGEAYLLTPTGEKINSVRQESPNDDIDVSTWAPSGTRKNKRNLF